MVYRSAQAELLREGIKIGQFPAAKLQRERSDCTSADRMAARSRSCLHQQMARLARRQVVAVLQVQVHEVTNQPILQKPAGLIQERSASEHAPPDTPQSDTESDSQCDRRPDSYHAGGLRISAGHGWGQDYCSKASMMSK